MYPFISRRTDASELEKYLKYRERINKKREEICAKLDELRRLAKDAKSKRLFRQIEDLIASLI